MIINRTHGGNASGHILRIAIGMMGLVLLLAGGAAAATLTVNASGGANYTRIQDAITSANAGDTILVYSGTYYENAHVNKQLTLRGIGMPVVNARGSGSAITLAADGITLDGFTATGSGDSPEAGIVFTSNNNTVSGNNANSNNGYGIYLYYYSNNNTLSGNMMTGNKYNFGLNGADDSDFNKQIDTSNLVDGKPIYYIRDASNSVYDSSTNAGTFYCINCVNVTIKNLNLNKNGNGIFFWNTTRSKIQNVNASNNGVGISLGDSSSNTLSGNNASKNNVGISLYDSSINKIYNNIFNNTINTFLFFFSRSNTWNTDKTPGTNIIGGPYLGGNFWANPSGTGFSQTCTDANGDGICDSTYFLQGRNSDYLPLAKIPPPPEKGSISGMKFNDLNGNGKWDAGELGLANWTITLTNESGGVLTNVTDANGNYSFTNLTDGNYTVGEVIQPGWIQTAPAVSTTGSATYTVNISGGNAVTDEDFGNFQLGSVSGTKFEDLNANGVRDTGEAGLAGWQITITGKDTIENVDVTKTATTDASGNYNFTGLTAGTYTITETMQPGWVQTAPSAGNYTVTITSGALLTGLNFDNFHKGNITGGGYIPALGAPTAKATFGIVGQYPDALNTANGRVEYKDHNASLNVKSIQINTVATTLDKKKGAITGLATVNGAGSYPFVVYVEDNGEPGIGVDVFNISLPTYPYSNGAVLSGGNIQIHS